MDGKRTRDSRDSNVKQLKTTDEKVFDQLFEKLWEPLYNYAAAILEDSDLAKDMVQEVWIDFWERRHTIKNDNLKAYLFKAVRFRVFKEIRDSKLKATHLEALQILYEGNPDEEITSDQERNKLIEDNLKTLPEKCKEVFTLRHINGLKNKEIAEELSITESTVENHITKAIKLIKKGAALTVVLLFNYMNHS